MGSFMKETNFALSISDIVRKMNEDKGKMGPWAQLSIPPASLSSFRWDSNLEMLFERLLQFALRRNWPGRPVRVAFCKRTKLLDVENHFAFSPLFWIHARIKANGIDGFETGIKETLQDLGYRCGEWIACNNSDSELGAFYSGKDNEPMLIVWIQNRKSCSKCDFLIPVTERNVQTPCGNNSLHSRTPMN